MRKIQTLIRLIRLRRAEVAQWAALRSASTETCLAEAPEGPAKEAGYAAIHKAVRALQAMGDWLGLPVEATQDEVRAVARKNIPMPRLLPKLACWVGLGEYL